MCSKRLGPQGEVGDTVVFERLFVSPTPSRGWDRVGTTGEVGTKRRGGRAEWVVVRLRGFGGAYSGVATSAQDPAGRERGAGQLRGRATRGLLLLRAPPLDPAETADPGEPDPDPILHPLGAATEGAHALQPFVPVVRWAGYRSSRRGSDCVHQEPGSADDQRDVTQGDSGDPGPSGGSAAYVGRPLVSRRHAGLANGCLWLLRP